MAAQAVKALKQSLASIDDDGFFDRKDEMSSLLTQIEMGLNRIAVVIGPNNSGKSALLKQLKKLWDSTPELKGQLPLFYIDMRAADFSTPELAAAQIARQMRTWASWLKDVGLALLKGIGLDLSNLVFKGIKVDASKLADLLDNEPANDLGAVMSWFTSLATDNPDKRPVFVVDEADRLKRWCHHDVETLLGGFVAMTKQDRTAVVILSSSDDLFRQWFQVYANAPQWKPIPVGHFGEQNALKFLSRLVAKHVAAAPDSWSEQKVYEVCGGCPLLLESCVLDVFEEGKSPDEVLEGMVMAEMGKLNLGLEHGQGWEVAKFEELMKLIVEYGAVGMSKVCRRLFNSDRSECQAQIKAMLSANVIHVRYMPAGVIYDDLRVFNRGKDFDFVMARSPAHHKAMKKFCAGEFDD